MKTNKILLLVAVAGLVYLFFALDLGRYFDLGYLKPPAMRVVLDLSDINGLYPFKTSIFVEQLTCYGPSVIVGVQRIEWKLRLGGRRETVDHANSALTRQAYPAGDGYKPHSPGV
jgi:hypothetical protein